MAQATDSNSTIHVSDIPDDVTEEEIKAFFKDKFEIDNPTITLKHHWNDKIPMQWASIRIDSEKMDLVLGENKFPVFKKDGKIQS